jgi:hypothetical protein
MRALFENVQEVKQAESQLKTVQDRYSLILTCQAEYLNIQTSLE